MDGYLHLTVWAGVYHVLVAADNEVKNAFCLICIWESKRWYISSYLLAYTKLLQALCGQVKFLLDTKCYQATGCHHPTVWYLVTPHLSRRQSPSGLPSGCSWSMILGSVFALLELYTDRIISEVARFPNNFHRYMIFYYIRKAKHHRI